VKPKQQYSSSHSQIVNFINYFGIMDGFEKILKLVKWELKAGSDFKYRLPLKILRALLNTIAPVESILITDFREEFISSLNQVLLIYS
jgi:hypothetical protein